MKNDEALEFWYKALHSEIGAVFETDSPERLRAKLYVAREAAADPSLHKLSIVLSPSTPNQLWIVKKDATEHRD